MSTKDEGMTVSPNGQQTDVKCQLPPMTEHQELIEEAKALVLKLLPPDKFGEDYDCERLWEILETLGGNCT